MTQPPPVRMRSAGGEPVWEIARLFPNQGVWLEGEYLSLETNHLVDFADGTIEVLPLPTPAHQSIVAFLYQALLLYVTARQAGKVLFAPLRVRLWPQKYREPDLVFLAAANLDKIRSHYWDGADLVMEVVSGGAADRQRDKVIKREEYARAGISEYWLVDPDEATITVLRLSDGEYLAHGEFTPGAAAESALLPGFTVDVTAVFAAAAS